MPEGDSTRRSLPVISVLSLLFLLAPCRAADLAGPYGVEPRTREVVEERRVVVVVPDCIEQRWAVLLHCAPRDRTTGSRDIGLVQIERSLELRRRGPYPELVPRR